MAKPRKKAEPVPRKKPEQPQVPPIPLTAVPHLFNAKVLAWMQTFYEALKTLHEDLDEIKALLKEN